MVDHCRLKKWILEVLQGAIGKLKEVCKLMARGQPEDGRILLCRAMCDITVAGGIHPRAQQIVTETLQMLDYYRDMNVIYEERVDSFLSPSHLVEAARDVYRLYAGPEIKVS